MSENRIFGIGASEGIRFGKAFLYGYSASKEQSLSDEIVAEASMEKEIHRLKQAKDNCYQELESLIGIARTKVGEEKAGIFKGHQNFLADPSFYPEMEKLVRNSRYRAERAIHHVVEQFVTLFSNMSNPYLKERAVDVSDVGKRLLNHLNDHSGIKLSDIRREVILVADDLTPSDTIQLDREFVLGFVCAVGGKTSHTAILANSLGIPAIIGSGDGVRAIQNDDYLIIDGNAGICIVNPDTETTKQYREKMEKEEADRSLLDHYVSAPAVTRDGVHLEIGANIGTSPEVTEALRYGAESVGLYRTEFLFMNVVEMPSEDIQYAAYKEIVETMGAKPVVIRTLDIGGDKELPYLDLPKEMNPFLGYRAIRLCLDQKLLFVTQIRAILRASVHGKLKIMFPMISTITEWREAKALYQEVRDDLHREQIAFDPDIELGLMIETPSAAVVADLFAKEADFFSIGTNDLVQYVMAVDRMNEKVAYLYDYFHPAVIRLIKIVIDAAHNEGKWVGMCGGMAGDPLAVPLLIGLGLDEWSMNARSIVKIKHAISQNSSEDCRRLVGRILSLDTAEWIRDELKHYQLTSEGVL